MTQWLVKRFVKNYEDVKDKQVRMAYGMLGSRVCVICNLFLFVLKFLIGSLLHSVSVTADAFNNLSDSLSGVIGYAGVRMAGKPADKDHPFGHGRMEYIAALIVAFLVIEVGISFFRESFDKIFHPGELPFSAGALVGLLASILIKCWMAAFNRTLGRKIESKLMEATATDARMDVLATSATIVSLVGYQLFAWNLDGVVGVIVACLIIWAGIGIVRDTIAPLLGGAVDVEMYQEITAFVSRYDEIYGVHDLIIHNYGPMHSMASIHAEISGKMDLIAAHELIDTIERAAEKELGVQLVIHIDPVELDSEEVQTARLRVETIVRNLDSQLSIHDFRLIHKGVEIWLVFDMLVPFEYDEEKEQDLTRRLEEILWLEEPKYRCLITFDKG